MRQLSSSDLLAAWDQGAAQTFVQRGLTLLAAAYPERSPEDLARLSIGKRDSMLLALREKTFGSRFTCLDICPQCGERLEFTLDAKDILAPSQEQVETHSISLAGFDVQFRLPNSLDLIALADQTDLIEIRKALIEKCIIEVIHDKKDIPVEGLPAEVANEVEEEMAKVDPQADVKIAFSCPACDHAWHSAFDIISFFWNEICTWSYRTLSDVHILASAYGWSEAEILSMSPRRRQAYLDMVTDI